MLKFLIALEHMEREKSLDEREKWSLMNTEFKSLRDPHELVSWSMAVAIIIAANKKAISFKDRVSTHIGWGLINGNVAVKYVWTSLMILGSLIPDKKFDHRAISVSFYTGFEDTYGPTFNPEDELGYFSRFALASLYGREFKKHLNEDAVRLFLAKADHLYLIKLVETTKRFNVTLTEVKEHDLAILKRLYPGIHGQATIKAAIDRRKDNAKREKSHQLYLTNKPEEDRKTDIRRKEKEAAAKEAAAAAEVHRIEAEEARISALSASLHRLFARGEYGYPQVTVRDVKTLLSQGAQVNFQDKVRKETVLMLAANTGNDAVVEYLLKNGANPNLKNNEGETASAFTASTSTTYAILKSYELLWAVKENNFEGVTLALRTGADVNFQGNTDGYTPLMHAVALGYTRIAELLLVNGADPLLLGHDKKSVRHLVGDNTEMRDILNRDYSVAADAADDVPAAGAGGSHSFWGAFPVSAPGIQTAYTSGADHAPTYTG